MFSHVVVGTTSLDRARVFYDALFAVLGYAGTPLSPSARGYASDSGFFKLATPLDGKDAAPGNGGTVGFACTSPGQVDRWHAAGIAHGGRAIEEPPGIRESALGRLYLAYLRDPDGNKLCALYQLPCERLS